MLSSKEEKEGRKVELELAGGGRRRARSSGTNLEQDEQEAQEDDDTSYYDGCSYYARRADGGDGSCVVRGVGCRGRSRRGGDRRAGHHSMSLELVLGIKEAKSEEEREG